MDRFGGFNRIISKRTTAKRKRIAYSAVRKDFLLYIIGKLSFAQHHADSIESHISPLTLPFTPCFTRKRARGDHATCSRGLTCPLKRARFERSVSIESAHYP